MTLRRTTTDVALATALAAVGAMAVGPARADVSPGAAAPGGAAPASPAPASPAPASPAPADDEAAINALIDEAAVETIELVDRAPPGAQATVGTEVLERGEYDDVHHVLAGVAGVYLRDEDGYGLRPNIGMRGAAAERSAKIALMEDGVLIAPAPYSAPAAYYFPLVTRMARIEVVKGPSAIQYGPNTVGGAIDLISTPMPAAREGYLDLAGGSDRYGKLHARAAERRGRWGVMAEYVKLRTDGFKQLDGGGDTGFDKDDASLRLLRDDDPEALRSSRIELRAGWAGETSNETYTGLSEADFRATPQRRYAATQRDQMNWDHWRLRADHRIALTSKLRLETTAYRHRFTRAWGKVDGFVGQRDFNAILDAPTSGSNAIYYAILTGALDSSSPEEELILGTNDRRFTSQGVQTRLAAEARTGPLAHHVDAGVRVHFDRADRRRYEDGYQMAAGTLVRSDRPRALVLDTRAETTAIALHAQDRILWRRLEVGAGLRVELIDTRFHDWRTDAGHDDAYAVVIPGAGALYHLTDGLEVLAGVHRGFVPSAPSAAMDVSPETSLNYEAGGRWRGQHLAVDAIGFFSDYRNLKGSCTFSTGCSAMQEGDEFDGGKVHVWGAEAQVAAEVPLPRGIALPIELAYTYTGSSFQTAFASDFAGWGEVEIGDELPYLPAHLVSVAAHAVAPRWELGAAVRWRSAVRDVAGQGPITGGGEAALTVDLDAHVRLHRAAELYATVSNLLDEQVIASRRPYGPRPNPPRLVVLGYKGRF